MEGAAEARDAEESRTTPKVNRGSAAKSQCPRSHKYRTIRGACRHSDASSCMYLYRHEYKCHKSRIRRTTEALVLYHSLPVSYIVLLLLSDDAVYGVYEAGCKYNILYNPRRVYLNHGIIPSFQQCHPNLFVSLSSPLRMVLPWLG